MSCRSFRTILAVCLLVSPVCISARLKAQTARKTSPAQSRATIPAADRLEPSSLAAMLKRSDKPVILQVGSHVLYAEAHIPGSEYVGAAGSSDGLAALRKRAATLKKSQPIVIYCGCCPWRHCPNIRPAYKQLKALGFRNVKALYIPDNFGTDWVNRGYPVAHGN